MKGKRAVISIAAAVVAIVATAAVASAAIHESANYIPPGAPAGYLKINPQTCKFLHPEIDVQPGGLERYARAEDSRDDVKLSCLTHKIAAFKVPTPDTCFAQAGPVPATSEAPADKQGYHDTKGLDALRAWANTLALCEANR